MFAKLSTVYLPLKYWISLPKCLPCLVWCYLHSKYRFPSSSELSGLASLARQRKKCEKKGIFQKLFKLILLKHSTINTLYPIVSLIYFSAIFNFSIKNSNKAKACERNSFQKDLQNILLSVWINFKFLSAHSSSPIRCFCKKFVHFNLNEKQYK